MRLETVRRTLAAALLLGAAILLPGPPAPAQETTPPPGTAPAEAPEAAPESEFFDTIDVSVVNVEVFVTDRDGKRVKGLTKDDFELFENGKPVEITNFYAVEEGRPALVAEVGGAQVEIPEALPEPAAPTRGVLPAEIPEEQRLHLVVYIDNWNIKPFNRNRVFVSLREFLRNRLSPGDRVMLMTYDREAHVRRQFTTDPATIAAALFEIEGMSAAGARLENERREILRVLRAQEQRQSTMLPQVQQYAQELHNELSFTLDSLRDLVESLAGLPGRKAVLYVSDGIEMVPGEDIFYALQELHPDDAGSMLESRTWDLTRRYKELVAAANSNRVSFYTIDAGGLRTPSAASAETRDPGASGRVDSIYWQNLQSSIRLMADSTGGLAIFNTNDPRRGLELVAEDFQSYYSLGYSPANSGTGRYNEIQVRMKRKGLQARHREGYRDKPIETRMSDGLAAALNFGLESNPIGLEIERGEERPRDDGHYLVPISVRIPIGGLTLVPQGNLHVARARLFVSAMDPDGARSEVQEARVPIEIPDAEVDSARRAVFRYDLTLVMRRGDQKLAVGLRDELGQASSFAVRNLRVGG
jgi:VWFA-related protein